MNKSIGNIGDNADQVADEAIEQLAAAVKTIFQLEAVFRACRTSTEDALRLVALGEYAAMDQGNGFDCARETLKDRLNNLAPRSAQSESVARETGGDQ